MEALDGKKNSNMLIAHPTGTGKSLPMLLLGLFLPEGIFSNSCNLRKSYLMSCSGSTTLIVPPLTTIEAQLLNDCERLGIPAVAGSKVFLSYLSFIHVQGEFFDVSRLASPKIPSTEHSQSFALSWGREG